MFNKDRFVGSVFFVCILHTFTSGWNWILVIVSDLAFTECGKCMCTVFLTFGNAEQHPDENDADDEGAEKDQTKRWRVAGFWKMDPRLAWQKGWYISYIFLFQF